jgi:hypothetical protein
MFSHCTKIFKQLFTVHGYKNVHYVPPSSRFFKLFLDSVTYNALPNLISQYTIKIVLLKNEGF